MKLRQTGRALAIAAIVLGSACSGEPPPERRAPAGDAIVVSNVPEHRDGPRNTEGTVPVHLKFFNISDLHRGFFAREEAMTALGQGLAACTEHDAEVIVSYDTEKRIGRIIYSVPSTGVTCLPRAQGGGVDLSELQPIGNALAEFRDYIAGTSDFRIANFRTGVHFARGLNVCEIVLGGQYPPDGRSWSPCVSFAGTEKCASKAEGTTFIRFPERRDQDYLESCLGL